MKNHLFIASVCITLTSIMHAESFDSFEQALVAPEKATTLSIKKYDLAIKHLPSQLGTLINLVELDISCLENLEDLPSEIGDLKKLEKLKRLALDFNDIHELPPFVGNLKNLQELSVCANGGIKLPKSLSNLNGLKIFMGNNSLKIKDQKKLRRLFPKATFSFENEFDDSAANEETPK